MQIIPINDVTTQQVNVQLNNQACLLNIYQNTYGLFMDVYVNNTLIIGGVACQYNNRIVRDLYLGFIGDLSFADTQGANDPTSPGLGTRYVLQYWTPADLNGLG